MNENTERTTSADVAAADQNVIDHGPKKKRYMAVFYALCVFTAVSFLANWILGQGQSSMWIILAVAVVIVQIVETLGGIRAVQAFRREPRNDQIFAEVNDDYRIANERAWKLIAVFVSGVGAFAHERARSPRGLAVWGAVAGVAALVALLYGVILAGGTQ